METEIWKYIDELAKRIKRIIIVFIASLLAFLAIPSPSPFGIKGSSILFYDTLIFWIIRKMEEAYLPPDSKLIVISVTAPLFAILQMAFYLSLIIAIPVAFREIYAFVSPALYRREKAIIKKYLLPFSLLYLTGMIYTIIIVLPLTFRALIFLYYPLNIELFINLNDFINIVILMVILGGLLFALPTLVLPLIEAGILGTRTLSKNRIFIYLIIAFIAGLISPDPTFLSVIPLLIPIYALYEATIYFGRIIEKKHSKVS